MGFIKVSYVVRKAVGNPYLGSLRVSGYNYINDKDRLRENYPTGQGGN